MNRRLVFTILSILFFNYVLIGNVKLDTSHKVDLVKQIAVRHGEGENIQQLQEELKKKHFLSAPILLLAASALNEESNNLNISPEERLKKRSAQHLLSYLTKFGTDGTGYKVNLCKRIALEYGEDGNTQQFKKKLKQKYNKPLPPVPILLLAASELNKESNNLDISPEERLKKRSAQHLLSYLDKQEKRSWQEKHPNINFMAGAFCCFFSIIILNFVVDHMQARKKIMAGKIPKV